MNYIFFWTLRITYRREHHSCLTASTALINIIVELSHFKPHCLPHLTDRHNSLVDSSVSSLQHRQPANTYAELYLLINRKHWKLEAQRRLICSSDQKWNHKCQAMIGFHAIVLSLGSFKGSGWTQINRIYWDFVELVGAKLLIQRLPRLCLLRDLWALKFNLCPTTLPLTTSMAWLTFPPMPC